MKVPDSKNLKSRCTFNVLYAVVCYVLLFIVVYYKIWNIDRRLSILWKLPILSELRIKLWRRNSLKNRSMFEVFRFYAACTYTYICVYSERIAMVLNLNADWYFNLRLDYIVSTDCALRANEIRMRNLYLRREIASRSLWRDWYPCHRKRWTCSTRICHSRAGKDSCRVPRKQATFRYRSPTIVWDSLFATRTTKSVRNIVVC